MGCHSLDAIVQAGKEIDQLQQNVAQLKGQKAEVELQIGQQQKKHESESADERSRAHNELRSLRQKFQEKEKELEQQLRDLRDNHKADETRLEAILNELAEKQKSSMTELRSKASRIEEDIGADEKRLEDLAAIWAVKNDDQIPPAEDLNPSDGAAVNDERPGSAEPTAPTGEHAPNDDPAPINTDLHGDEKGPYLSEKFPTVVWHENKWCEIACFICSANTSVNSGFLKGWTNLRRHISQKHKAEAAKMQGPEILNSCIRRRFSEADVARMRQGEQPLEGGPITSTLAPPNERNRRSLDGKKQATRTESSGGEVPVAHDSSRNSTSETVIQADSADKSRWRGHDGEGGLALQNGFTGKSGKDSTHDGGRSPPLYHPGNIILQGNGYIRIRCKYCGTNTDPESGDFIAEIPGMLQHLKSFHVNKFPKTMDWDSVTDHCIVEKVSPEEYQKILWGDLPNKRILPSVANTASNSKARAGPSMPETRGRHEAPKAGSNGNSTPKQNVVPTARMGSTTMAASTEQSRPKSNTLNVSRGGHGPRKPQSSKPTTPSVPGPASQSRETSRSSTMEFNTQRKEQNSGGEMRASSTFRRHTPTTVNHTDSVPTAPRSGPDRTNLKSRPGMNKDPRLAHLNSPKTSSAPTMTRTPSQPSTQSVQRTSQQAFFNSPEQTRANVDAHPLMSTVSTLSNANAGRRVTDISVRGSMSGRAPGRRLQKDQRKDT